MSDGLLGVVVKLLNQYGSVQALIGAVIFTCVAMAAAFYYSAKGKAQREKEERDEKRKKEEEQLAKKKKKEEEEKERKKKAKAQLHPKKEPESPLLAATIKGHEDEVTAIAFNPKGGYLASFSKDRTLRLHSAATLTEKDVKHQRVNLDLDYGERASFSSDGRYLLTTMADTKNIRIYEMKKGKDKGKLEAKAVKEFENKHKAELNTLVMASNSKFILSCDDDTSVMFWGIPHANVLETLHIKKGGNHMAALSPDAKYFTLATATGEVVIWEISQVKKAESWEFDKTKKIAVLPNGHRTSVNAVCFSHDGHMLVTGSKDCTWRLWDVNVRYAVSEDPRCIHTVKLEHPVDNLSLSPDDSVLLVFSDGDLYFYDTKTAALLATVPKPHEGKHIISHSWSPDSAFVATAAAQDRAIKLWRKPTQAGMLSKKKN